MKNPNPLTKKIVALCGMIVIPLSFASAEDSAGVVRITDHAGPHSDSSYYGGEVYGESCGSCQGGGTCRGCGAHLGGPPCRDEGCHLCRRIPGSAGISNVVMSGAGAQGNGERYPADYGFVPPAKLAISHEPVKYYRYWPTKWYGQDGAGLAPGAPRFPVVYTPTDTTQLGYYYQRVPKWMPNPGMIPPPPWPPQWHLYETLDQQPHRGRMVPTQIIGQNRPNTDNQSPVSTPAPLPESGSNPQARLGYPGGVTPAVY